MSTRPIERTIAINAPAQSVWHVLTNDALQRQWFSFFSADTTAVAQDNWKEGSKVTFADPSGNGMICVVETNDPPKELSLSYEGFLSNGTEDYDSEGVKAMAGGHEVYVLDEQDGSTTLSIRADMADDYYDMMAAAWDKAVDKIKELAEQQ